MKHCVCGSGGSHCCPGRDLLATLTALDSTVFHSALAELAIELLEHTRVVGEDASFLLHGVALRACQAEAALMKCSRLDTGHG
jgi:hypothetical protein